jgi:hypothetical protein
LRPSGAGVASRRYPRLAPWALFFRRSAALAVHLLHGSLKSSGKKFGAEKQIPRYPCLRLRRARNDNALFTCQADRSVRPSSRGELPDAISKPAEGIGVLRLRTDSAARNLSSAQDDIAERVGWIAPSFRRVRKSYGGQECPPHTPDHLGFKTGQRAKWPGVTSIRGGNSDAQLGTR